MQLYHESVKCPLFHIHYEVLVGYDMRKLAEHVEEVYPGLDLSSAVSSDHTGYTMFVRHPEHGSGFWVLIRLRDDKEFPTMQDTITHESVHLSWEILDAIGIKITVDNHETQAYLVENTASEIRKVVEIAKSQLTIQ